jgi:hypothetical protein
MPVIRGAVVDTGGHLGVGAGNFFGVIGAPSRQHSGDSL